MAWRPCCAACSRVPQWLVVGMVLFAGAESAHGQRLIWLGTLGGNGSSATGVSADGSVVVGTAKNASGLWRAFRWTAQSGMQELGTLGGDSSRATAVSPDGSIVVGWAQNLSGQTRAFRWTAQSGMQDLGSICDTCKSWAYGVSADGSVVVGVVAYRYSSSTGAFRWTTQSGMQVLGTFGGRTSIAHGVSADGRVVVGLASKSNSDRRAFRWTAEGGMQDIGTLGGSWSEAYGVSDNGLVVVGRAINTGGQWRAFLWDVIDEMHNLSTLPGYDRESVAYGVSGDGTMVVGASYNSRGESHAFLWDTKRGMQDLNVLYDYLRKDSSILLEARTITPNGRYIVGVGYRVSRQRYEAYLLDTQGTSSVDDGSEGEVTITISPQPFAEQGWVQVRLGRFEQARVEVRDMLGRLVTVLDEGVLGEQRWQLPQLAAGVYTVVVRTGHGVSARQFVVTR